MVAVGTKGRRRGGVIGRIFSMLDGGWFAEVCKALGIDVPNGA